MSDTLPDRYVGDLEGTASPLVNIRSAIAKLDDERQALETAGMFEDLCFGLDAIKKIETDLAVLRRAVEGSAARTLPGKRTVINGLGVAEKVWINGKEVWEWERLLPVIIQTAVDPDGTGELPTVGIAIERIRKALMSCVPLTPSTAAKVTGLKDRGIDPEKFRVVSADGRESVRLVTKKD